MLLKSVVVSIGMLLVGIMGLMYVFQRHLIYLPAKQIPTLQEVHARDFEWVLLHTDDGLNLRSWYKPAAKGKPTVLYLHGNAGSIGNRMPIARQFVNGGVGVLLVEYRGFGGNPGSPSEAGLYTDARAGLHFLQQHGVSASELVIYGESIGTGVATQLATEYRACAVVLQSPFTSLASVARYHYPWVLFIKPWDRFDSIEKIRSIHAPLLILHGKKDPVVPYQEGLTLFNQAVSPKKMVSFDEGTHSNLWGYPSFAPDVLRFIHSTCS